MKREETSAAILAGGRARRLGGLDKSRLVVAGRSIIVRQLGVLQLVAHDVFVVAPDPPRFADLNVTVHVDVVKNAGTLGGILTAIEHATASSVVVVGCDMPFLNAGLLTHLVETAQDADAAWVVRAGGLRPEPLVACYRKSAAAAIRGAIDAGRLKAGALNRVMRIAEVSELEVSRFGAPEKILANINTPEDYARIK